MSRGTYYMQFTLFVRLPIATARCVATTLLNFKVFFRALESAVFETKIPTAAFSVLLLVASCSAASASTHYLSTSGNDSNSGASADAAWQTLAKLNSTKLTPGSHVYLQCGSVFRASLTIANSGTSTEPISYGAYGDCTGSNPPRISGADRLTNWSAEKVGSYTVYYASEENRPAVVFEDNHRLTKATSTSSMAAGSFYYNSGRVYVRTRENGEPESHTIEASVRGNPVTIEGASYINITGVRVDKGTENDIEAWGNLSHVNLTGTITNYSYGNGIWFTAAAGQSQDDVLIKNCTASYNGETGIMKGDAGNNFVVQGCTANYNAFDQQYLYTGGIRLVSDGVASHRATNSGILQSYAAYNGFNPDTGANEFTKSGQQGTGIWCDTCGDGSFLRGNVAHDNTQDGIQLENSGATGSRSMSYNVSYRNGWAGVAHSRSSHNDIIANNTAYDNPYNCFFQGEFGGGDTTIGMVDNIYENNICAAQVIGKYGAALVAQFGAENNDKGQGHGNIYRDNSFGEPGDWTGWFAIWGSGNVIKSYAELDAGYGSSTNSMQKNPMLENPAAGNFNLMSGSPAIDRGYGHVNLGAMPYVGP